MTINLTMKNFYNILSFLALLVFTSSCQKTENILIEPSSTTIENTDRINQTALVDQQNIKPTFLQIEDGTTVSEDGQKKLDADLEYLLPTIKSVDGSVLEDPIETVEGKTIELNTNKKTE